MKTCFVCQVIDTIGESIVSTFLAPSMAYAKRQFVAMVDGTKGAIPTDFKLVIGSNADIYDTFKEVSDDGIVGITYEESKSEV